jgi:hypothetical protein
MKKVTRLTSLILVISILMCCFSACDLILGKDPTATVEAADLALLSAPYTVEMAMKLTSEDAAMSDAIADLITPVIVVEVYGENVRATMNMNLDGNNAKSVYTLHDGIIYSYTYEQTNGSEKIVKEKWTSPTGVKEEIIDMLGSGANIRFDDFKEAKERGSGTESIITCTDIKDEALYGVANLMQDKLASLGAMVGVKDASLIITISDGKYQATVFSCTYIITTPEAVYTVSMNFAAMFDYDKAVNVTAPLDAGEYIEKSAK